MMNLFQTIRWAYLFLAVKWANITKPVPKPTPRYVDVSSGQTKENIRLELVYGPCDGDVCFKWSPPYSLYVKHPYSVCSKHGVYVIYNRVSENTYHFAGYAFRKDDLSFCDWWKVGQGFPNPKQ